MAMDKDKIGFKFPRLTTAETKLKRIQFLNCQLLGCQRKMDMAVEQLALAQAVLEEARDQLEAAHQALERVAMET